MNERDTHLCNENLNNSRRFYVSQYLFSSSNHVFNASHNLFLFCLFFFSSIRSSRSFPHSLDDSDILALTDCKLILSHSLFVSSHCRVHFRHLLALAWHELLLLWSRWNDSLLWRRKRRSFSRSYFWWNPCV